MPCAHGVEISLVACTHNDSCYVAIPPVATCTESAWSKSVRNKKWFKLVAQCCAEDAFWCPKEECIKNQSNLMLAAALDNEDGLYWEAKVEKTPSPKCKCNQVEEESIDDLISTVKTASTKKPKSALKGSPSATTCSKTQTQFQSDSQMGALQNTMILQLTEMVSAVQHENKTILSHFDQLAEQITMLMSQTHPHNAHPARGQKSSQQP